MTRRFDRIEFATRFGRRLRAARANKQLSQASLAAKSGYVTQTISRLERGITYPSLVAVFVLAEVLDVHPERLLFGEDD